jgi:hypothetical protein
MSTIHQPRSACTGLRSHVKSLLMTIGLAGIAFPRWRRFMTAMMAVGRLQDAERRHRTGVIPVILCGLPGGSTWKALCPAHDDQDPSLSITEGDNGRVLLHCFAGCDERAILQAMGLTFRDLFPGELSSNGAALGQ